MSASYNPQRAALVVNARSRKGCRTFSKALALLIGLGVPVATSCALDDPARLPETVHRALLEGHDLIILGGGDGSVSSVVGSLADQDAVLGVLPLGTANDFARTLEIPLDLEEACRTVARGKVVDVDLGLAGSNHYVNVASVGLSVEVTRTLSPPLKRTLGVLAYPLAAVRAFFRHQPFSATLTFPDGDYSPVELRRLLQVAVGNGRFHGGGIPVSPDASLDDRILDVYVIELGRPRDLIGTARYLKSGDFIRTECVSHYRTSRVRLETEPQLPISVDGELVAQTPEIFSLVPNALKVLVPQASTAARYDWS